MQMFHPKSVVANRCAQKNSLYGFNKGEYMASTSHTRVKLTLRSHRTLKIGSEDNRQLLTISPSTIRVPRSALPSTSPSVGVYQNLCLLLTDLTQS